VPDCVTLPQYFRRSGYQTLYIGKVFHPRQEDDTNSWDRRIRLPDKGGESSGDYTVNGRCVVILRAFYAAANWDRVA
jgi:arylsulfatase A-like enzyme